MKPGDQFLTFVQGMQDSHKFSLFIKAHEIREINKSLESVMSMPEKERSQWFKQHGQLLQDAFDRFIDDSNSLFDGMALDEESLELSKELITSLKSALHLVEGGFPTEQTMQC